ncbi:MAG: hypothetical protein ACI8ZO_001111 [Flavobacteriales bacterium]|jgi:uncharacterized protein (TIGR00290 family)
MSKIKSAFFWSGGKDSALALYKCLQDPTIEIVYLVCTLSVKFKRISMHGVHEDLLDMQASSIGIPLKKMWMPETATNLAYEEVLSEMYQELKSEGVDQIVFGDIFLEDLKEYRDDFLAKHKLKGIYPLWLLDTTDLAKEFIAEGFKTRICCINDAQLNESFVGRLFDESFLKDLPEKVDTCGENGEFHTFCFEGPIFKTPIAHVVGKKVYKPLKLNTADCTKVGDTLGFWYIELLKKNS